MRLSRLIAVVLLSSVLMSASCSEEGGSIRETSVIRQCRANMNTLCTNQATFAIVHGNWAATTEELDETSGRIWPLSCPETGDSYINELRDSGDSYIISCPAGHGSIETGRRSWSEGSSE